MCLVLDSNMDDSDLWSNTLPLDPGSAPVNNKEVLQTIYQDIGTRNMQRTEKIRFNSHEETKRVNRITSEWGINDYIINRVRKS